MSVSPSPANVSYESPLKKPKVEICDEDEDEDERMPWEKSTAPLEDWESDDLEIRYRYIQDEDTRKEVIRYYQEYSVKGPYNMDFFPTRFAFFTGVLPVIAQDDPLTHERMEIAARFAIDEHNKLTGTELELDCVNKANYSSGYVFYITLVVKDTASGIKKTCQTKVRDNLIDECFEFFEFLEI